MLIEQLPIAALARDGSGIGFLEGEGRGRAIFVPGALPGDLVSCRVVKTAPNYLKGELLETPPRANPPLCPHALCGGCPLGSMAYPEQLRWKERLVADALQRIGGLSSEIIVDAWRGTSPNAEPQRNKITLAFGRDESGAFTLGLRQRQSHLVTAVDHCALVAPEAMAIAASLRQRIQKAVRDGSEEKFWQFLTLRQGMDMEAQWGWRAVLQTGPADATQGQVVAQLGEGALAECPQLHGFVHVTRRKADGIALGERTIWAAGLGKDATAMSLPLGGKVFGLGVENFFQVNLAGAEALAQAVQRLDGACDGVLWDLYCGAGAPGQLLAQNHNATVGIEIQPQAVQWARKNAESAGLRHWRYKSGATDRLMRDWLMGKQRQRPGLALLDPPRGGLGPKVTAALIEACPQHIIYVSCNAATLARDGQALGAQYQLSALELVDMFPHTPHSEICSLWTRKEGA